MKILDRIWLAYRHLKSSLAGSLLVILAIAIGASLAASTSAFIRKYNEQTDELLNHPHYREVIVESLGNPNTETELPLPVMELNGTSKKIRLLNLNDLPLVQQSIPSLTYAYLADSDMFYSSTYLLEQYADKLEWAKNQTQKETSRDEKSGEMKDEKTIKDKEVSQDKKSSKEKTVGNIKKDLTGNQEKELDQWLTELKKMTPLPMNEFMGYYTTPDFFKAYGLLPASGSLFAKEDLRSGNQVMILGSQLASAIFPDGEAVGSKISASSQTYTILGVLKPTDIVDAEKSFSFNDLAFVPHSAYGGINYGKAKRGVSTLRFSVNDSADIERAVTQLREYITTEYPDANLRVTSRLDNLKNEREKLSRILVVLLFLTAAGLLIAAINMFNLLLIRVIKHTKGIGILRALGFTRNNVLEQFLAESLGMSFMGILIGLVFSPFLFNFLQSALMGQIEQSTFFWDLLLGALGAFLFSILFGIYPALTARQTDTATALRTE